MNKETWWQAPVKIVGGAIIAFFLGGVVTLLAQALTEMMGKHTDLWQVYVIYLAIGGSLLLFWRSLPFKEEE